MPRDHRPERARDQHRSEGELQLGLAGEGRGGVQRRGLLHAPAHHEGQQAHGAGEARDDERVPEGERPHEEPRQGECCVHRVFSFVAPVKSGNMRSRLSGTTSTSAR